LPHAHTNNSMPSLLPSSSCVRGPYRRGSAGYRGRRRRWTAGWRGGDRPRERHRLSTPTTRSLASQLSAASTWTSNPSIRSCGVAVRNSSSADRTLAGVSGAPRSAAPPRRPSSRGPSRESRPRLARLRSSKQRRETTATPRARVPVVDAPVSSPTFRRQRAGDRLLPCSIATPGRPMGTGAEAAGTARRCRR
jgi:hypothetical protein